MIIASFALLIALLLDPLKGVSMMAVVMVMVMPVAVATALGGGGGGGGANPGANISATAPIAGCEDDAAIA